MSSPRKRVEFPVLIGIGESPDGHTTTNLDVPTKTIVHLASLCKNGLRDLGIRRGDYIVTMTPTTVTEARKLAKKGK